MSTREGAGCTLLLLDPVKTQSYGPPDKKDQLALEIDLTTPLAYMWSRTDLDRYRWTGLLRPEKALERANLLLIRPYEPGKIPVVMVHGLISTPLAWIPMLNELLRDPVIQQTSTVLALHVSRRGYRSRSPPRACAIRCPGQADVRPGRPRSRRSTRWSCWGTAWGGC